jgi:hypothetical protein
MDAIRSSETLVLIRATRRHLPEDDNHQRQDLYLPQANLTIYQKGVYYVGIIIFNKLPIEIKNTANNFKNLRLYQGIS